nr:MAG TPA: hypothetical protein [Caudoviricetes sp.]
MGQSSSSSPCSAGAATASAGAATAAARLASPTRPSSAASTTRLSSPSLTASPTASATLLTQHWPRPTASTRTSCRPGSGCKARSTT